MGMKNTNSTNTTHPNSTNGTEYRRRNKELRGFRSIRRNSLLAHRAPWPVCHYVQPRGEENMWRRYGQGNARRGGHGIPCDARFSALQRPARMLDVQSQQPSEAL